jgi:hypothetical protein
VLEGITGAWVDLVAPNVTSLATGIPKKIACATKKIALLVPQLTGVSAQTTELALATLGKIHVISFLGWAPQVWQKTLKAVEIEPRPRCEELAE